MRSTKKKYRELVSMIKQHDYREFKYLWKDNFDLEYANARGRTLLHWATYLGEVNIAQFLVARGAGVETEDVDGITPLSLAAANGNMELTTFYLDKGATPDGVSRSVSPLVEAAGYGQHAIVALLLEHGADANIVDENGDTALVAAATKGRYFTAKILLEHGASTKAPTDGAPVPSEGYPPWAGSPLHWAVKGEYPQIVQLLLDYGADVEAALDNGVTPLANAAASDDTAILQMLLEKEVSIDGSATTHAPLLMAAAWQSHSAAELLISRGANVNITDNNDGDTALILATMKRDLPMMKLLLDAGADTSLVNEAGETALDVAKAGKFKKGVALLKSYANKPVE